MKKLWRR